MKKKITKKLALSKETLRNLSPVQLRQVAGGESWECETYPCTYPCPDYSVEFTCGCTAETTVVEPQTRNC